MSAENPESSPLVHSVLKPRESYPKVNVKVAGTAKLAVANLEGHCHLVALVQALMEALAPVRRQLDVVCGGCSQQQAG